VNFSSMGGLATVSGVTLYAASKFAVRGLSLAADKDLWGQEGIAVTCFMPDAVQTPMVDLQLRYYITVTGLTRPTSAPGLDPPLAHLTLEVQLPSRVSADTENTGEARCSVSARFGVLTCASRRFDEAAMAFSGDILSLDQVEACILGDVLHHRPAEVGRQLCVSLRVSTREYPASCLSTRWTADLRLAGMAQLKSPARALRRHFWLKQSSGPRRVGDEDQGAAAAAGDQHSEQPCSNGSTLGARSLAEGHPGSLPFCFIFPVVEVTVRVPSGSLLPC
jgi:hypothetical protein